MLTRCQVEFLAVAVPIIGDVPRTIRVWLERDSQCIRVSEQFATDLIRECQLPIASGAAGDLLVRSDRAVTMICRFCCSHKVRLGQSDQQAAIEIAIRLIVCLAHQAVEEMRSSLGGTLCIPCATEVVPRELTGLMRPTIPTIRGALKAEASIHSSNPTMKTTIHKQGQRLRRGWRGADGACAGWVGRVGGVVAIKKSS